MRERDIEKNGSESSWRRRRGHIRLYGRKRSNL